MTTENSTRIGNVRATTTRTLSLIGLLLLPVSCGPEASDSKEVALGSISLAASCGTLASGTTLTRGNVLNSCNGAATLAHQTDGNVVVYQNSNGAALWATNTHYTDTSDFAMQTDGNLVLYRGNGAAVWTNNMGGHAGAYLALQDDCNLVEWYNGSPIWATNKVCTSGTDPILIGAGDIAKSGGDYTNTGNLVVSQLNANPGSMAFTLGDDAYGSNCHDEGGSWADYTSVAWNYNSTPWASSTVLGRLLPNPGNHEYNNCDLNTNCGKKDIATCTTVDYHINAQSWVMSGYYTYFNSRVPNKVYDPGQGGASATNLHYVHDFTTKNGKKWLWISLDDGFCFYANNCSSGSSEYNWLSGVLSGHLKTSKGGSYAGIIIGTHIQPYDNGWNSWLQGMWNLSASYNVDLWLVGHAHKYQNWGRPGGSSGPFELIVGSGGADGTHVVGKVAMHDSSWEFWALDANNGGAQVDYVNQGVH